MKNSLHDFVMREAAVCGRIAPTCTTCERPMRKVARVDSDDRIYGTRWRCVVCSLAPNQRQPETKP